MPSFIGSGIYPLHIKPDGSNAGNIPSIKQTRYNLKPITMEKQKMIEVLQFCAAQCTLLMQPFKKKKDMSTG
jgi:hypothetical protein